MKYAVLIDVDGDWMYVPENSKCFKNHPDPKLFLTIEEAEEEQGKWNTGIVVEYISQVIKPMTQDERQRAKVRAYKNGK